MFDFLNDPLFLSSEGPTLSRKINERVSEYIDYTELEKNDYP